jgi:uncharacterized protein
LRSLGASSGGGRLLLPCALVGLSVYNGYFGAGSGVMLLALMLVVVEPRLPQANALKNMLLGPAEITAAVLIAILSPVDWAAVAPLAAGLFVGSTIGPWVARRTPAAVLRWVIAAAGLGLAVHLWIDPAT